MSSIKLLNTLGFTSSLHSGSVIALRLFLYFYGKNFRISFSLKVGGNRGLEIHRWFTAQTPGDDVVGKAGIGEKADHWRRRLASPL